MKHIYLLLFLITTSCFRPNLSPEETRWKSHTDNVEIIRDDFGVPHIYGKTDADAVFGLLYAQCEDDFNRVEQNYIWATGRLAEVEGEEALYSDLRARLFMTKEEAIYNYDTSPAWLKKLCNAFADGINYYLHTHPEVKPRLLTHFEPWMPMYFSEGSIGGDIEYISIEKIKNFYKDKEPELASAKDVKNDQRELAFTEPGGSNGFAISGKLTESGKAMLLINPHTSFFFRGEVHVVSEEGLNAYGAVTWGQFFVYQGFNEKTGWMHTSTYTDFMDDFKETIIETDNGYKYQYGNEQRPVLSKNVTLDYLDGDELKEKTFTMYHTHHGPITHSIDSNWVATSMMWDPVNALIQSFTRTKMNGHQQFREMMNIRTNSSNNTVYADAEGNIAYYHGNFIPKRDIRFDYSKPVDGSEPATDWQGLHTVDENITVLNPANGWIQNCNSTPYTAAGKYSPKVEDYPYYMSKNIENFRGIHAIRLLEKASELTLDKLIDLAYDPYLPAFEIVIPGLVAAYDALPNPQLKEAIEVLRQWDFAVSTGSVGMTLAHYYTLNYLIDGTLPEGLNDMEKINYIATKSPPAERLEYLQKTLTQLNEDFGSWQTPWGEINRYQRLNGDINLIFNDDLPSIPVGMASGRWGALAAFGMRSKQTTKRIYGTRGNSFIAVVEFGDTVKAKSLLAGGQSGDPSSPHFNDQAQRYADVQFKDVAYYREDVEKRARQKYHPGEEK
jgi:acyl-homoserine lactone acylase PvdQ